MICPYQFSFKPNRFLFLRLIFFEKSSEKAYFYEDKLKDSRRQLVPLAQILGVPENRTAEQLVGKTMLDFRDVKEEDNEDDRISDNQSISSDCISDSDSEGSVL